MNSDEKPHCYAPRFHAYLEHVEGRRLLVWDRETWDSLKPHLGEPVLLDVSATPMAGVFNDAAVVAAAAQEVSSSGLGIGIYRYDSEDAKPYNVDLYSVWENLPARFDFDTIVEAASTEANPNLLGFLEHNVFVVQLDKGPGHWLSEEELPTQIKVVISDRGEDGAG